MAEFAVEQCERGHLVHEGKVLLPCVTSGFAELAPDAELAIPGGLLRSDPDWTYCLLLRFVKLNLEPVCREG